MASNSNRKSVKLLHGIVVKGATEPKGSDQTFGAIGDVVDLDIWTAQHLISCGHASEVEPKSASKR